MKVYYIKQIYVMSFTLNSYIICLIKTLHYYIKPIHIYNNIKLLKQKAIAGIRLYKTSLHNITHNIHIL